MWKNIKLNLRNQNGHVLILVLLLMLVGILVIPPALSYAGAVLKSTTHSVENQKLLYTADSGVQDAFWQIQQTTQDVAKVPSAVNTPITYSLPDINNVEPLVTILCTEISDTATTYKVTSTATDGSLSKTVEAYIVLAGSQPVFEYALATLEGGPINLSGGAIISSATGDDGDVFCGGTLELDPSAKIEGDCYALEDITTGWGCTIDGDATSTGTTSGNGTITGTTTSGAQEETPPSVDTDYLNGLVQGVYDETCFDDITPSGTSTSSMTVKSQTYSDPIYIIGDLSISNCSPVFNSQVYVTGNVTLSGGTATVTFNGPVYIGGSLTSSGGTINVYFNDTLSMGSCNLGGSYYFYFNGAVKVAGNLTVGSGIPTSFGSTIYIGGNFNYGGSSDINIDDAAYIGGALNLTGSAIWSSATDKVVNVVVRGNVSISGASSLIDPSSLTDDELYMLPYIIVPPASTTPALASGTDPSTITISGSGAIAALIYAPTAELTISGTGVLCGSAICESVTMTGSAKIIYTTDLEDNRPMPGIGGESETAIDYWHSY